MSAPTRSRPAVPRITYLTRNGKKIGRPSQDPAVFGWLTTDWERVRDIYRRLEDSTLTPDTLKHRLHRAWRRWPSLIEHDNQRGYRRRPKEES